MGNFKFTSEAAEKEYKEKFEKLQRIAGGEINDNAYLWDSTVQKYASKMMRVNNILKSEGINGHIVEGMFKNINTFLQKCSGGEFEIALVGAIKAGKSTLINALLGYEYASTKVTPETASLTKFKKGKDNYVKVSFYKTSEWKALWDSANEGNATVFLEEYKKLNAEKDKDKWLNKDDETILCNSSGEMVSEIQKWTSSKSGCHYFVKEVEVGLKDFNLPEGVVLVDTPGLDDAVEYRSQITREYIDRANAVLVCVKSDALTGGELDTIIRVFKNTKNNAKKVYIIATQIDTLNRPEKDWEEQEEEWLKHLKKKGIYADKELARKNLVPVSAYLYTLLKERNNLSEDKQWDLKSIIMKYRIEIKDIDKHYKKLLQFTKIDFLKDKLQKEIVNEHKKLLIKDIEATYELRREEIQEKMQSIKDKQEEIIRASQEGLEAMQKKQEEYNKKYQEAEQDRAEFETVLKKIKELTTRRADELEEAIKKCAL